MAQKVLKLPENMKNHTFLNLLVIASPEILLKLLIKLIPDLVKVVQPYFIKQLGVGVQKCSKILKNGPKRVKFTGKYEKSHFLGLVGHWKP